MADRTGRPGDMAGGQPSPEERAANKDASALENLEEVVARVTYFLNTLPSGIATQPHVRELTWDLGSATRRVRGRMGKREQR